VATVWRFTVGGTDSTGGQEWNSTMHYLTDVPLGQGEPNATKVLEEIVAHFGSTTTGMERWLATVPSTVKLTFARVYEELPATSTEVAEAAELTFAYAGAVAVLDPNLPFAMCVWIKFGSGLASRSSRGGTHLSPTLDQNHLTTAGIWDTSLSWWSANVALANYMKEKISDVFGDPSETGDINPVIYSRTRRNNSLTPYTFPITSAACSSVPRWIRRRDVGR